MPEMFFTLDEIAKKIEILPPKLEKIILKLKETNLYQQTQQGLELMQT